MGSTYAMGLNEAVDEGIASLRQAVHIHLTSNHYPPIPTGFVELAKKAVERANLGEWDDVLECDEGWTINGATSIEVRQVVEIMNLQYFLEPANVSG